MITVIISEVDGWREWKHRARTKDAQTAIIRAMNKHFPRSYNFIPDDIDNAPVLFAAVTRTPNVKITGHIWKPMWNREFAGTSRSASNHHAHPGRLKFGK